MTEAILNNMIQASKQNVFPEKKKSISSADSKSFSEAIQEVNQRLRKSNDNSTRSSEAIRGKRKKLNKEEFLQKLKEVLNKDQQDVPSELLSMLQSGSLNREQKALLGKLKLMLNSKNNKLNLKHNNLSISELESLLEKNRAGFKGEKAQLLQLLAGEEVEAGKETKSLNPEALEMLSQDLKEGSSQLSEAESSELINEIDKLSELILNTADNLETKVEPPEGAKDLKSSLADLISTLKSVELDETALTKISKQAEANMPLLSKLLNSEKLNLSNLDDNLSTAAAESLFAELSAQLKDMLKQQNLQTTAQQSEVKPDFINSELFSLNSDLTSAIDSGVKLEANNQNNFFDLDNSNLLLNLGQNNQELNGNFSSEMFNLSSQDSAQAAEKADLRAQVVEQFRGEYSAETKEMQLQLKPESLGKIDISLSLDNEELTGKMLVESEVVRAQLENSLKGLKSDLLKQGINIEQFKIETAKNAPQQVNKQENFAFNQEDSAFSDGETGQNQEYEQRQFFQGQYYVQRRRGGSDLDNNSIIMRQQEMINRAAFSNDQINLLA